MCVCVTVSLYEGLSMRERERPLEQLDSINTYVFAVVVVVILMLFLCVCHVCL